jgi:acetyl esterase/lipase
MSIRTQQDVVYGHARIGYNKGRGPMQEMALKLDAYLPAAPAQTPMPALVMGFGGAFHRGSKEDDTFTDTLNDRVGTNTPVSEYCRRFAALGIPSFSVQYRLAQTDPEPGVRLMTQPERMSIDRANLVRTEKLGLPPIEPREMAAFMEAAFEDFTNAVRFLKRQASDYGIDPARMVLGGFSAGGMCATYAAFGRRVGAAGVVVISGTIPPVDTTSFLRHRGDVPPLLVITGEHDLGSIRERVPATEQAFRLAGRPFEWAEVPGGTHFYAAESKTRDGRTVFDVIRDSVTGWVGPASASPSHARS